MTEDSGQVGSLGGGGALALYGVREVGCCHRLRSSEMSGMSWSSGACLPVSLALVSGMHIFLRGRLMPAGQACLGRMFSVFEVQSLLLNPGLMFVHCLKLCQLPGRPCPPPWFSLYFILGRSSPCRQQSKESTLLYSSYIPHTWIFSLTWKLLSPTSPAKVLPAGLWP